MTAAKAADIGPTARWILLFFTLFGLATMHTMGHAGIDLAIHPHLAAATDAASAMAPFDATEQAAPVMSAETEHGCAGDHCGGQPQHDSMTGWSVCLAILSGLATMVLLVAALLGRSRDASGLSCRQPSGSRIPGLLPRGTRGLTLASSTVLRI